jgi:hypothetical protein
MHAHVAHFGERDFLRVGGGYTSALRTGFFPVGRKPVDRDMLVVLFAALLQKRLFYEIVEHFSWQETFQKCGAITSVNSYVFLSWSSQNLNVTVGGHHELEDFSATHHHR